MPYVFNPFSGSLDNAPSTFKGDSAYTTVQSNSSSWLGGGVSGDYLPLSGGTMTGKLIASADSSFSKLNIGSSIASGAPTTTVDGDVWITNQNRLAYKSSGNVINLAGLSQQNTFSQPQSIGSTSNAAAVFTVNNTGSREAATFVAQGTSPAVRITQNGTGNALTVEDSTNPDATPFIVDALGSVGVGLSSLSGIDTKLTVVGTISSTSIIYASGGNSDIWNSTYTTVSSNSANWQSTYTNYSTNSALYIKTVSTNTAGTSANIT